MNLKEARDKYYESSAKASELTRSLALAGIGIAWVFKNGQTLKIPGELLLPCALFVFVLMLDYFQYTLATLMWSARARLEERKLPNINKDPVTVSFVVSPYFNWPGLACFWSKIATIFLAYSLLFAYVFRLWLPWHATS